jgi:hypothetical protein
MEPPTDLIIDGAVEDDVLLCLYLSKMTQLADFFQIG